MRKMINVRINLLANTLRRALPASLALLCLLSNVAAQTPMRMPLKEKMELARQLSKIEEQVKSHLRGGSSLKQVAEGMEVMGLDLNGDKQPELIIKDTNACGGQMLYCRYYVVRKSKGGYELLLSTGEIEAKKISTRGYRDLWEEGIGEAGALTYRTVYKYDGRRYREFSHECWREDSKGRKVRAKC